ncbi:MAG: amidase [Chloroflexi bacterium]|nr:amidase [Chloroflexota bacterium]MBV9602979.1 amidase [Chloroflexota bacterium]
MSDFPQTIKDAAAALRGGQITSAELTRALLERIDALNPSLGAFIAVTPDTALAAARKADVDLRQGIDRGPLHGIPLGVKDIIATRDAPTTANSHVLDRAWGDGWDAPVVERLRDAGGVILGKTVTSEFACGAPDPDNGFPLPKNPWNLEHSAAGSSAGSGISIAAGLALGALGTDTGGSVRGPAAANGHTGLKVTFGRVPKFGCVPLGYGLDSVGPMARTAWDCAALLRVMAGYDARDPTAANVPVPDYTAALTGTIRGLRIGVPTNYFFDVPDLDAEVKSAVLTGVEALRALGAIVTEVHLPHAEVAKTANNLILAADGLAYHHNDLRDRWLAYGRYTRTVIARGAMYNASDYVQALRFRAYFKKVVASVMADLDVLVTPTSTTPAEKIADVDMTRRMLGVSFTGVWNLVGLPALAVPCGFSSSGLPLSMQIVGKPFDEASVLRVGDAYQQGVDWQLRVPPMAQVAVTA